MTLIGEPQLPANTYRDFENYIKANSGKLNLAHAGSASPVRTDVAACAQARDRDDHGALRVAPAPAMTALMSGQVDVMCDQTTNTTARSEAGRVKAFAVTTARQLSGLQAAPGLSHPCRDGTEELQPDDLARPLPRPRARRRPSPGRSTTLQVALKDPDFIKRQEALGAIVATDKANRAGRAQGLRSRPDQQSLRT